MQAPVAISVNFDSLNEAYGFPGRYTDPSFFAAFDRLASVAAKHGLPLSIYIIGKDLENADHFARVREWAAVGHEIGNHSWSHHCNIGTLSAEQAFDEVRRSHDLIAECIGSEPRGFIAPAWATSGRLVKALVDLGYVYDTSIFPSVLLYPMVARIAMNHRTTPLKALRILQRLDWLVPLTMPTQPFFLDETFKVVATKSSRSLLVLPLPTVSRFAPAIWHTVGFIFGWDRLRAGLDRLLQDHPGFYYLIHPADFLGPNDLDTRYNHNLARMEVPLDEKLARLSEMFSIIAASGRPRTSMAGLARYHGAEAG